MLHYSSTATPFDETLGLSKPQEYEQLSPLSTPIHNLDDDSLFNIFYFCQPNIFDENQDRDNRIIRGGGWARECWWYKPVQVCQRWRRLILESASYLRLCLVCTHGTPVREMLAHSPPFPLVIDLNDANRVLTTEDEERITLALQHRDRVRCIHLEAPARSLKRLVTSIDDEFPMLEYMHIAPQTKDSGRLSLPPTFEAPNLRHLVLYHFASPLGSPLLTTATGLVTLLLRWIHPSSYPHPNHLLETLAHLPQLETLQIGFRSPVPNHDIKMKLWQKRVITHVALPHLHWFSFAGVSAFLEALLPHMTTPRLVTLKVHFFNQLSYHVPRLLHFITTNGENLRFSTARICFHDGGVAVWVYPHSETTVFAFYVHVLCEHFDWQVSSMAQILSVLEPAFSPVADLTLDYAEHSVTSEWHNQASSTLWRRLLGSFRNIKTISVQRRLIGDLTRSPQLDELEGPPLDSEQLPELKEFVCPRTRSGDETFAPFIDERRAAGRPTDLISSAFLGRNYVVQSSAGLQTVSTVDDDARFRILCAGRVGAGKSSIINHVLGLEGDNAAVVYDWKAGEADITKAFTSIEKGGYQPFSVHDSEGFEPGDTKTYDNVHQFILKRHGESSPLEDRLDAIWLCAETPRTEGRVVDESDVKLLQLAHELQMPVVFIFTKYDLLIRSRKDELQEDKFDGVLDTESRKEAQISLDKCVTSLQDTMKRMQTPMPPYVQVSTHPDYRDVSSLIKVTNDIIRPRRREPRDSRRTLMISIG